MKAEKLKFALSLMTPKQARRWRLYFKYHSLKKVAAIEGVAYQAIQKSLHSGIKRAKLRINMLIL